jgi:hypothetical protein
MDRLQCCARSCVRVLENARLLNPDPELLRNGDSRPIAGSLRSSSVMPPILRDPVPFVVAVVNDAVQGGEVAPGSQGAQPSAPELA